MAAIWSVVRRGWSPSITRTRSCSAEARRGPEPASSTGLDPDLGCGRVAHCATRSRRSICVRVSPEDDHHRVESGVQRPIEDVLEHRPSVDFGQHLAAAEPCAATRGEDQGRARYSHIAHIISAAARQGDRTRQMRLALSRESRPITSRTSISRSISASLGRSTARSLPLK